ncbi:molybdopterin-dependent oxidoreductase [Methanothermobacter sp. K4]|uniref:molybdopterin-dependent oxidoreductase n=1 Tax=Methanothermobacter sp. K4 TaxID=2913262 RepID=UPI001EDBEDED|nr:molybdopterin-dependent oxidoreductase [Methanothermobacter sp. K4]MCG2827802.1 molybdopterin-dependent oxidoreductase [Methanothermobacter sp. K4]
MRIFTTCTRDCPGSCGLTVRVEGGVVRYIRGSRRHPHSRGFLCRKTAKYHRMRLYSDKRILKPLMRDGNQWRTISWDEALQTLADAMNRCVDEYGAESIVYYQGFGARTALRLLNRRFFNSLGATTLEGTLCGGTAIEAHKMDFGRRISHEPSDHLNSRNIFIWGRNPAVTDLNLWRIIRRAQRNGKTIVTVDPVRTQTAARADVHCQVKPGTDMYLAIALSKIIVEEGLHHQRFMDEHAENSDAYLDVLDAFSLSELSGTTGVPERMMYKLAFTYSDGPSSIIIGWGLQRYFNSHITCRFIDALAAISGNIGIRGGGVNSGFDEYGGFDESVCMEARRKISMPLFGGDLENLDSPEAKCVFITAGNPVNLGPNSMKTLGALREMDLVVMVDHFLNDTSYAADIFLPATIFLEETDLAGSYGHPYISPVNAAVRPLGECRSEFWIIKGLSELMGLDNLEGSLMEWLEIIAAPVLDYHGIEIHDLLKRPYRSPGTPEVPFEDLKFYTESGKFVLPSEVPPDTGISDENSLRLLTVMTHEWIGSREPYDEEKLPEVFIHPETLLKMGLGDGETVTLESGVGRTCAIVRACDKVYPGCALSFRGTWLSRGGCINTVIEDGKTVMGHGTPYHETRIKIKKRH